MQLSFSLLYIRFYRFYEQISKTENRQQVSSPIKRYRKFRIWSASFRLTGFPPFAVFRGSSPKTGKSPFLGTGSLGLQSGLRKLCKTVETSRRFYSAQPSEGGTYFAQTMLFFISSTSVTERPVTSEICWTEPSPFFKRFAAASSALLCSPLS